MIFIIPDPSEATWLFIVYCRYVSKLCDLANTATGGCPGFGTRFLKKVASKRPRGVGFFLFWASDPIETYYYKA